MEIRYIETQDRNEQLVLIIQIDNELEITLDGYGSGEAKIRLRNIHNDPNLIKMLNAVPVETWDDIAKAVVWASPVTIAHLVYETVTGQ